MIKQIINKYIPQHKIDKAIILANPIKLYEALEAVQEHFNRKPIEFTESQDKDMADKMKVLGLEID